MALEHGIPIIPVFAETLSAPLWLRHLQRLDFSSQADWQGLVQAINQHIQQPNASPQPAPTSQPKQPSSAWASASGDDQYGHYADLNVKGVIQRFRWLSPGKFLMGSPLSEPERGDDEFLHEVTLSQGFWLADTACTQALWQAVMGGNPAKFKETPNNPVENVSWDDAQGFIKKLNSLAAGLHLRLPMEAEWEYACRAGTGTRYSFGNDITKQQVNYNKNVGQTVPVKSLPANPWGLYEMHGNVWEWCQDWYGSYPAEPVVDPQGSQSDFFRVLRGGSWFYNGRSCRSADRHRDDPGFRRSLYGFRLARGL
ncbi:MAG: formylglycine-generating enzyme family protein [Gammaproteobacteria bacterium]|nr:formylglycine-generating enzyme family protein [Gammaproteobacteria bacterium]MBU1724539.1 formylglycine-generating enzyme family protein [Gammaproteobacteria bacterium]MBU2004582.1 formylglycine-generating enzyme family protein [Gammaproteobacteria bacterium]